MAETASAIPGRIFISYRREETAYAAGWLFDRLSARFRGGEVFKDVDSIELGDDFIERINDAVGSCDVLLALIGEEWVTITDEQGRRRLDDPADFVRLEIEAALVRKVRVIPVVVDGARLPRAEELPPSLAPLARRQALELSPSRFDFDTSRLLRALEKTLVAIKTPLPPPGPESAASVGDSTSAHDPVERRDATRPRSGTGWLRRPGLLALALGAIGVVVLVSGILLFGADDDESRSQSTGATSNGVTAALGQAIPAETRPCRRAKGSDFWLDGRAREQAMCTAPSSDDLNGGALNYGLFSDPTTARTDLIESFNDSLSPEAGEYRVKRCDQASRDRVTALKREWNLTAFCVINLVKNAGTVEIWWNETGSRVSGYLSFDPPTKSAVLVEAWARLIEK